MKPLEGIKVVELSTMLAGPMTARLLAEWGADVIKVESMNGESSMEPRFPRIQNMRIPTLICRTSISALSRSICVRRKEKRQ